MEQGERIRWKTVDIMYYTYLYLFCIIPKSIMMYEQ